MERERERVYLHKGIKPARICTHTVPSSQMARSCIRSPPLLSTTPFTRAVRSFFVPKRDRPFPLFHSTTSSSSSEYSLLRWSLERASRFVVSVFFGKDCKGEEESHARLSERRINKASYTISFLQESLDLFFNLSVLV